MIASLCAPPRRRLQTLARVSNHLAVTSRESVWALRERGHGTSLTFLEGPVLDGHGGFYLVDVAWGLAGTLLVAHLGMGAVWVYDARGVPVLALQAPEGLATTNVCVDATGRVYVTESESGSVLTLDLATELRSSASAVDGGVR